MIAPVLHFLLIASVSCISIQLNGENVYLVDHQGMQYFLFIEDKEATITCTVTGTDTDSTIQFLKEGRTLDTVLPSTLYTLERTDNGQTKRLKLRIDASGYTDIEGNWTCSIGEESKPFKTLCGSLPNLSFEPALVNGVAREGSTIRMRCNCDSLDQLKDDREWSWLIDNGSPAGSRISYEGSTTGAPTSVMVITNLQDIDTASYSCSCKVGPYKTVQLNSPDVQMTVMRPPRVPENLVVEEATMNSLTVSWQNSDDMGVVLDYKIAYKKEGSSSYREVSTGVSVTSYVIRNLDALTDYNVKIAAANNAGSGAYSEVATFTTAQPSESRPVIVGPKNYPINADNAYLIETGIGIDIPLMCEVNSYPASVVEWSLNDRTITTQPTGGMPNNYERSVHKESDFTEEYTLYIMSTRPENDGIYKCRATNTKGTATISYAVQVSQEEEEAEENRASSSSLPHLSAKLIVTLFIVVLNIIRAH